MPAPTENEIIQLAQFRFPQLVADHGLHSDAAALYAVTDAAFELFLGRRAPRIISGLRTAAHQRALHEQGRPAARQSWHLVGRAIDLDAFSPDLELFESVWTFLGGRAGSSFGDPNHFDVPGAQLPPPAF